MKHASDHDPLRPHSHDNNPTPPDEDPTLNIEINGAPFAKISLSALQDNYPHTTIPSYTYTTDHGQHGPYRLSGVRLLDLIEATLPTHIHEAWRNVAVLSADGFGNRLERAELKEEERGPVLLCLQTEDRPLSRAHGLVRLVVPSETDNALRQIKWVRTINVGVDLFGEGAR